MVKNRYNSFHKAWRNKKPTKTIIIKQEKAGNRSGDGDGEWVGGEKLMMKETLRVREECRRRSDCKVDRLIKEATEESFYEKEVQQKKE